MTIPFLDALPAIEAVIRRHLPPGYRLFDLAIKPARPGDGNPAPFELVAYVQRLAMKPEPTGWVHDIADEIRRGWDNSEFRLGVTVLPDQLDADDEDIED